MKNTELLNKIKAKLVKTYNPLEIYLFGSYAWGNPTEDSDLDILIVVEKSNERFHKRVLPAYDALLEFDISKDILIYTRDEFEQRANDITTLCYQIKKKGNKIYAIS